MPSGFSIDIRPDGHLPGTACLPWGLSCRSCLVAMPTGHLVTGLRPGCQPRTKTLTIFITPRVQLVAGAPGSFSTLFSNSGACRASNEPVEHLADLLDRLHHLFVLDADLAGLAAGVRGERSASAIPALVRKPRGPLHRTSDSISNSRRRPKKLRSRILRSSSRLSPDARFPIRSIAIARSSLSTPRREKTRTSTMVPATPWRQTQRRVAHVGGLFRRRWRAAAFLPGAHRRLSPFGVTLPTEDIGPASPRHRYRRCPPRRGSSRASSPTLGMS